MNSDTELMLDVGQANELKLALRRAGFTNANVKALCEGDVLSDVLSVVRKQAKVEMVKYIINCDEPAIIPSGYDWQVRDEDQPDNRLTGEVIIERKRDNHLYINGNKVLLHRSRKQQGNKTIISYELYQELKGGTKVLLPANILDYLLAHPELIPDSWKDKVIFFFFWGTIYRSSDGYLRVRFLCRFGDMWYRGCSWLGSGWYSNYPAAVLASN